VEIEFEKYSHNNKPEYEKSGYGIPSEGIFANPPKTIVKIIIVTNGWSTAQDAPNAVCLYRTFISFQDRKYSSSLY
jgi:hypothetical protein